jgi:hypothetical protein
MTPHFAIARAEGRRRALPLPVGDEFVNWAIFEPNVPSDVGSEPIDADDGDLRAVFEKFDLSWG